LTPSSLPPLSRFATSSAMTGLDETGELTVPFGNSIDVAIDVA
jgi:hypothetical protein